jgi:general secretion pathway protein K
MKRRFIPPPGERGAALLAVLLLVAVMGAIAATAFEKLRLSTAVAINAATLDQARAYALGIEDLMALRVDDLVGADREVTTLAGNWQGTVRRIPLPGGGLSEGAMRDGGNCFNLNSLVEGDLRTALAARPQGIRQFIALMTLTGIPDRSARTVAAAAADWADSDDLPAPEGAEDAAYAGAKAPYRTGNTLFAEVSELRAVMGITSELYSRLKPWLCALPMAEPAPINVNTLSPDQAPVLAMLEPNRVGLDLARAIIARRPSAGWATMEDFLRANRLEDLPLDALGQLQLGSRWFALDLRVEFQGAELIETALIDARLTPSRVAARRWGNED